MILLLIIWFLMRNFIDGSPNTCKVIKTRRLRWVCHVVKLELSRSALKVLTGIPIEKSPLGRPGLIG